MPEPVVINGKKFITSKEAASLTGYARDYVGQLVRMGKVEGKVVEKVLFVSEESLLAHVAQKNSNTKVVENFLKGEVATKAASAATLKKPTTSLVYNGGDQANFLPKISKKEVKESLPSIVTKKIVSKYADARPMLKVASRVAPYADALGKVGSFAIKHAIGFTILFAILTTSYASIQAPDVFVSRVTEVLSKMSRDNAVTESADSHLASVLTPFNRFAQNLNSTVNNFFGLGGTPTTIVELPSKVKVATTTVIREVVRDIGTTTVVKYVNTNAGSTNNTDSVLAADFKNYKIYQQNQLEGIFDTIKKSRKTTTVTTTSSEASGTTTLKNLTVENTSTSTIPNLNVTSYLTLNGDTIIDFVGSGLELTDGVLSATAGAGFSTTSANYHFDNRLAATTTLNNLTTLRGLTDLIATNATVTTIAIGSDYITDITGSGLSVVNGALTVAGATGFSTTSADYWESTKTRWATTSDSYAFDTRLAATSTLNNINILNGLASIGSTTGTTTIKGVTVANGNTLLQGEVRISNQSSPTTGAVYFGSTNDNRLTFDGSNYMFNGTGALFTSSSGIISQQNNSSLGVGAKYNASLGTVYFGASNSATPDALISNSSGSEILRVTNGGNLGLGTSSPYAKLSVVGQTVAEYFTATSTTATSTFPLVAVTNLNIGSDFISDITGAGLTIVDGALTVSNATGFSTTSADYWDSTISRWSTTSDVYSFDTSLAATTTLNNIGTLGGLSSVGSTSGNTNFLGKVSIGSTTPWGLVSINPSVSQAAAPSFVVGSSTRTYFVVTNGGLVGIGTTTPTQQLSVNGNVWITGHATSSTFNATSTTATSTLPLLSVNAISVNGTYANSLWATTSDSYAFDTRLAATTTLNNLTKIGTQNSFNFGNATGSSLFLTSLDCTLYSNGGKITTDSNGMLMCANDSTGSGSGGGGTDVNWTFINNSGIAVSTTTNQVVIGASATSSLQKLQVSGGVYITGNVGIGTTSPYENLSVAGNAVITGAIRTSTITATSTEATSTLPLLAVTAIAIGSDYITDITGSGLSVVNGALTVAGATGFSTTSADYWDSTKDRWGSTSASYYLSLNQGSAYSTTSADYWLTTKSTSDLTEGSNKYWTDARFDTRLAATTTLPNLAILRGLTDIISTRATTTNATSTNFFATTASTSNIYVGTAISIGTTSQNATLNIERVDGSNLLRLGRSGSGLLDINMSGGSAMFRSTSGGLFKFGNEFNDNQIKSAIITMPHFTSTTEEPVCLVYGQGATTTQIVGIGGGPSGCNAATALYFYTAATGSTTSGTQAMAIGSSGSVVIGSGNTNPLAKLYVQGDIISDTSISATTFTATSTTATSTLPLLSVNALTINGNYVTSLWSTTTDSLAFDTRLAATTTLNNLAVLNGLTDIISTRATTTNATSTNFFATTASSTNLFAQTIAIGTTSPNFTGALNITRTDGNTAFYVARTGSASIGINFASGRNTLTPSGGVLNISNYGVDVDGADKSARLTASHYNAVSQSPMCWTSAFSTATSNTVAVGGGSAVCNTATNLVFYTATSTLTTGGTVAMHIDGNQRIGVGTQSPVAKLDIVGASASTSDLFRIGSSTGATYLIALANGNIGIATTSPYATLSVAGQAVAEYFTATSTTATSTFPLISTNALSVNGTYTNSLWATTSANYHFDSRLAATTTLNNITTLGSLSLPITQTTGTLSVSRGGTGQTSFGQGWLASDGTTLTSSTSPTVNYITATSTTATSTLPLLSVNALSLNGTYLTSVVGGTGEQNRLAIWSGSNTLSSENSVAWDDLNNKLVLPTINATNSASILELASTTILRGNNTQGSFFAGQDAGNSTGSGFYNTAFGQNALQDIDTGTANTALGRGALTAITSGSYNIGVGYNALPTLESGSSNVVLGSSALSTFTSGDENIVIGPSAGGTLTSGSYNILLGSNADAADGVSNAIAIGYNARVDSSNSLILGKNVNVGIGTTSPYAKLSVVGQTLAEYFTATSTTATSTLPILKSTYLNLGSNTISNLTGTGLTNISGALTVDTASIVGTGVAGQVPYFASAGSSLTATSSLFIATSSWVGIGTTTPQAGLHVVVQSKPSYREDFLKFNTTDVGNDAGYLSNGSVVNGNFITTLSGYTDSSAAQPSLHLRGMTSAANDVSDSASFGLIDLLAVITSDSGNPNNGTLSSVTNRKLLTVRGGTNTTDVKFSISANGNTGIGSSTPWGLLAVNPSGVTGPSFVIGSSTGTSFIVTNGGNVGIGTSSPYTKFAVVGESAAEYFTATSTTATSTFFGNGLVSGNFAVGSTSPWGKAVITNAGTGPSLVVEDSTSDTDPFIIDASGNVGIGTTSPGSKLEIAGGSQGDRVRFITTGGAGNRTLSIDRTLVTNAWSIQSTLSNTSNTTASIMLNPSGGSIGIGTTTTSLPATLAVQGSGYINSTLYTGGDLTVNGRISATSTTLQYVSNTKVSTLYTYGDSITQGALASSSTQYYPTLMSNLMGYTLVNQGVNGSVLEEAGQIDNIYAQPVSTSTIATFLTGYNNHRYYGTTASKLDTYKQALPAALAYLAIPDKDKVFGPNWSTTGTWTATSTYATTTGIFTRTAGATATATLYGNTIYVVGTRGATTDTGTITINVDGTDRGTYNCYGVDASFTSGRKYAPFMMRISNLNNGQHVVKVTSNNTGYCEINWGAGNTNTASDGVPAVYVGGALRMTDDQYANNSPVGTMESNRLYNQVIEGVVKTLASDGLNVIQAETEQMFDPATMMSYDAVHPNALGHFTIAQAFLKKMSGTQFGNDKNFARFFSGYIPKLTIGAGTSTIFTIDGETGRFGVGTSSPIQALSVNGNAWITGNATSSTFVATSTTATSTLPLLSVSALSLNGVYLNNLSIMSSLASIGSTTGTTTFEGNGLVTGNFAVGSTSPWGKAVITNVGTGPSFIVEDSTSDTSPFIIDTSGNVGIGTTSPTGKFEIAGGNQGDSVRFITAGGASNRTLVFDRTLSTGGWALQTYVTSTNGNGTFVLNPVGGNVGIGTTTPYAKLSVNGETVALNFTSTSTTAVNTFPRITSTNGTTTNATSTNFFATTASTTNLVVGSSFGFASTTPWGNVGIDTGSIIGATNPSFVVGSSTKTDLAVFSNGNVTIGTTTSNRARLSIRGTDAIPTLMLDGGLSGINLMRLFRSTGNGGTGQGLTLTAVNGNTQFCFGSAMSETSAGTTRNCFQYDTANANLLISTSTTNGVVTGIESFILKNSNGNIGLSGSSTPWGNVSINPTIYTAAGQPTFVVGSSTKTDFIIDQMGEVGVGTTSPWRSLSVVGTVAMNGLTTAAGTPSSICMNTATKEITVNAATSCVVSDRDQKQQIKDLTVSGLDAIRAIRPVTFAYNDIPGRSRIGFIAQDLQAVDDRLGDAFDKNHIARSIDIPAIMSVTVKAVQELDTKVDSNNLFVQTFASSTEKALEEQKNKPLTLTFGNGFRFEINPSTTTDKYLQINSSTGDGVITFNEAGNVGIGTSSSSYKLQVAGDIAATAFVNVSTRSSKKDIEYVNDDEKMDALEKLSTIKIARYHYKSEDSDNPLRLGLIAEEAPIEILSANGKGVDIYKLSTFTLSAVQAQQKKISDLEIRLSALEARVGSTTSALSSDMLASLMDGMKNIFTDSLTVGSATKPSGITLFDEKTGEPYCIKVVNGEMKSTAGKCTAVKIETPTEIVESPKEETASSTATTTPEVVEQPKTETASSTESSTSHSAPVPEPVVETPKVEEPAPAVEAPKTEAPKEEVKAEAPKEDAPKTEAPKEESKPVESAPSAPTASDSPSVDTN